MNIIFKHPKAFLTTPSGRILNNLLQIPTPKVGLFGTPLKIDPKIRKISKIQIDTEIALVNEIHRNLRQMEALGLYFQVFLKF